MKNNRARKRKLKTVPVYHVTRADRDDAEQIRDLVSGYAAENLMLPRSLDSIGEHIRDFLVVRDEQGVVIGCLALQVVNVDLAEIRSLAVAPDQTGLGVGSSLVQACLAEAERLGLRRVFALTFVDEFFRKFGFHVIPKQELPHKIWTDCIVCPFVFNCREIAMIKEIGVGQTEANEQEQKHDYFPQPIPLPPVSEALEGDTKRVEQWE